MFQNQILRYLLVGGWNTFFGACIYALLYRWLGSHMHYLLVLIPANVLAITNAYLGYKIIVFKTRGNYWREYLRCYAVYGGMMVFNAILLYVLVTLIKLRPPVANVFCVLTTTVVAYFSHKHFSFRTRQGASRAQ